MKKAILSLLVALSIAVGFSTPAALAAADVAIPPWEDSSGGGVCTVVYQYNQDSNSWVLMWVDGTNCVYYNHVFIG